MLRKIADWIDSKNEFQLMKLVNPNTGKPYRRGDLSPDGKRRFWKHKTNHLNKDGYFSTSWKSVKTILWLYKFKRSSRSKALKTENQIAKATKPKDRIAIRNGRSKRGWLQVCPYSSSGRVRWLYGRVMDG